MPKFPCCIVSLSCGICFIKPLCWLKRQTVWLPSVVAEGGVQKRDYVMLGVMLGQRRHMFDSECSFMSQFSFYCSAQILFSVLHPFCLLLPLFSFQNLDVISVWPSVSGWYVRQSQAETGSSSLCIRIWFSFGSNRDTLVGCRIKSNCCSLNWFAVSWRNNEHVCTAILAQDSFLLKRLKHVF